MTDHKKEYVEWKEQTLAKLEELCSEPDTALGRASEASGDPTLFVQTLFEVIDQETFRGNFTTDIEVGPGHMLKWLESIRSDEAWTGKVPFAKEGHPGLREYVFEDAYADSFFGHYMLQSMDQITEKFIACLKKEGLNAAAGIAFAEEDDIRNELQDSGLVSFDLEMKSHGFNCNILLAHKEEGNFDFGAISDFKSMYEGEELPSEEVVGNNSLSWLIRSQGYSMSDLYSGAQLFNPGKESAFLDRWCRRMSWPCKRILSALKLSLRKTAAPRREEQEEW